MNKHVHICKHEQITKKHIIPEIIHQENPLNVILLFNFCLYFHSTEPLFGSGILSSNTFLLLAIQRWH